MCVAGRSLAGLDVLDKLFSVLLHLLLRNILFRVILFEEENFVG
jgi:hypothetical protein